MPASTNPTELLLLCEVEERTRMGKSNVYRLIALDQFPRPIQLGGSKWDAKEVEEFIRRLKQKRDRQHGPNNFEPRPSTLSGHETGVLNESFSDGKSGTSASQLPSTVRMLRPELCEALRMLKLDIPELYLDHDAWNVSLAVVKVELSPAQQIKKAPKRKKR